jgi:hypothetical protein
MHQERNFWRNHPDQDSVAMALYIKLKQKKENAARKAEIAKSLTSDPSSPRHSNPPPLSPAKVGRSKFFDDEDEVGSQYSDYHGHGHGHGHSHGHGHGHSGHKHDPALAQSFTKDLFKKPHKSAIHMLVSGDGHEHEAYLNVVSPQGLLVMSRTDGHIRPMDPRRLKAGDHGNR